MFKVLLKSKLISKHRNPDKARVAFEKLRAAESAKFADDPDHYSWIALIFDSPRRRSYLPDYFEHIDDAEFGTRPADRKK